MRRILITGGTGFVGPYLIRAVKTPSTSIAVLSASEAALQEPGVRYYQVDLRDRETLHSVIREYRPDEIYHLAGVTAVNTSRDDPRQTFEVNVVGACNLFDGAISLASPPRILNISTSQVYAPSKASLTEDSPMGPDNPYAMSKAMVEFVAQQYNSPAAVNGIITARAFNHTGPGQSTNFVLSSIARQFAEIQNGSPTSTISIGNTEVRRDFTDVRDVVRAYQLLMSTGRVGETYNVCSGSAVALTEIIELFRAVSGIKPALRIDSSRARSHEVQQVCGDPRKIFSATEWRPQISLAETAKDLLAYWRMVLR